MYIYREIFKFKGDKGKKLDVQSQIYQFVSKKAFSVNSFQKLNFVYQYLLQKIRTVSFNG